MSSDIILDIIYYDGGSRLDIGLEADLQRAGGKWLWLFAAKNTWEFLLQWLQRQTNI
jgi:hypothetical protein